MSKKENIEIDISLEEYFLLNEAARKENMLLDDFVEKLLREYIKQHENEK